MLKKILFFLLLFYIQFFIFIEFSLSRVNYFLNLNFKLFDIFIVVILFIVIVFILAIFLIPKGKFIVWVETELVLYILVHTCPSMLGFVKSFCGISDFFLKILPFQSKFPLPHALMSCKAIYF